MRFALTVAACILFAASTAFAGDGPLQAPDMKSELQKGLNPTQKGLNAAQKGDPTQKGMMPLQRPSQKASQKAGDPTQKPYQK